MESKDIDETDDLMLEIVLKLPMRSLARFKCVSKTWHSRIQDFCIPKLLQSLQLQVSSIGREHHVHYIDNTRVLYSCSLFLPRPILACHLLDCCNGLLLLWVCDKEYVVCNPVTKQYVSLKLLVPRNQVTGLLINAALAFDPSISPHYKVVLFDSRNNRLLVFSSKSWSWNPLKYELQDVLSILRWDKESIYFCGAIYKLSKSGHVVKFSIDEEKVASDRVRAIKLPKYAPEMRCYGVSNGSLHYANVDDGNLQIWVLNGSIGDECEWVLKYTVSCQTIGKDRGIYSVHPCAIHPFSDIIFLGCDGGKYPNVYYYDFSNQTLEP
ncbi:conserved hypothetical protein [Ricinus communis]|uniref:Uncharacterized protein n=2 Tax=Ricinus communis TaxID=3988 RepID=B9R9V8_RICCO|nr:conserved hypothetical protein [Ricinus communis]|eukprot:XP_025015018.1 F-box protein At5g07610-like [Ricinus communis]